MATTSPNGVAGTWSPATISNTASASYVFTPTAFCNIGQTLAVTVNTSNAPIALATQVFAGSGTIGNLTATGSTIQWYTAATAGAQLPTTAPLVDGTTYYASQTVSGCISPTRVAVTVKKISEATQTLCATATVANLASTPGNSATANWFTGLSGGTALLSTASLSAGPYYVEQSSPLTITTLGSGFNLPPGVAMQADGKILVADTFNNAIKIMNADGTNIVTLGSGFNLPRGVAVQADGKILVADTSNGAIKRMNADGTIIGILGSGFSFPRGVAVQADGKILVADTNNNTIKRMNSDGTSIETLGSGFSIPLSVAVQADGKILVADLGNSAIKRMNTDGTGIETLGSGFFGPAGVAVQSDGKILVADTSNNAIKRMNADGTGIVTLDSGFNSQRGVAVQADGKILVADTNSSAIKRITEATVSNRVLVNVVINGSVTSNFAAIPALCAGTTAPTLATTAPNGVAGTWSPATVSNTAGGSYVFTPTAACNVGQTLAVTVNPVATSNFAAIPAFCVGTTAPTLATTSPNGVAGTWSPATISNTTSGSYVFTPTAVCNIGQTLAVTVNPVATSNFAAIPALCAGTTAPTLATTAPNGVAGTWSPATISNTASGSYVFTPTTACNVGQTLAVTVKTISATSTRIQVTCNGGSNGAIDLLNVSGGTAPYS